MIPHLASHVHIVTDSNGDKHEIGLSGIIEDGESYAEALAKVTQEVMTQSEQYTVNFDDEIANLEREVNLADDEINNRLDSLGSFTSFAEVLGMDFKPPTPFAPITNTQEIENVEQGTETSTPTGA